MITPSKPARYLAQTIKAWLSSGQWGEHSNAAIEFKLATQTDDQLIAHLYQSGIARYFPAGRAELQAVLDVIREEYRTRAWVGAVEMERRRREAEWR